MVILFVCAEPEGVELVERILALEDMEVRRADGFRAGVEMLDGDPFDAVVVDRLLGAQTGLEFVAHVRRRRPEIPVVMISDVDSRPLDDAALEAGAAGFVPVGAIRSGWLARTLRYAVSAHSIRPTARADLPRSGGKDLTLQVALARGMTIRDAAAAAGMSERTAYRRLSDPTFEAQLAALRAELRERMLNRTVDDIEGHE